MIPLIPAAVIVLAGVAGAVKARRTKAAADPSIMAQRQVVYETALELKGPDAPLKLRTLAQAFGEQGMIAEANMLMKRAALQETPDDVKEARTEAFRVGMASTDVAKITELAAAFESLGSTTAASRLREYAAGLSSAAEESSNVQA